MCMSLFSFLYTLTSYICGAPARPPMRRYASDISGPRRLEEDDAGYVADSSSSSSEYGDGEERPLLRRETEWWASAAPSANASVETVVAVGKVKEGGAPIAGSSGGCGHRGLGWFTGY